MKMADDTAVCLKFFFPNEVRFLKSFELFGGTSVLEKRLSSVQFHRAIDRIFMEIVNAFCGMGKTMRH